MLIGAAASSRAELIGAAASSRAELIGAGVVAGGRP